MSEGSTVPNTKGAEGGVEEGGNMFSDLYNEIVSSPVNMILLAAIVILLWKILKGRNDDDAGGAPAQPPLPKMKKQDMTLEQLRKHDGNGEEGRVLVAINGKIFDVTKGKRFYGPGGPYSSFAGHDCSRALALFQTDAVKEEYDDLSDLSQSQMESVREWEEQLGEKYDFVGKLLKPGEEPTPYTDEEEEEEETNANKKDE